MEISVKRFVVIDGHSLLYRAFFAFIRNPLYNSKGQNTSALFGFLNMFSRIIDDYKPDYLGVVQDKVRGGFRMDIYSDYKAHREATPSELKTQFPLFDKLLASMGIKSLADENFEGDDIIGSFCQEFGKENEIFVVTGDKDSFQLLEVSPNVRIVLTKKGISEVKVYDRGVFREEFGFDPIQIIDYKALTGDKSDNIPGVRGIGDKTATSLIQKYGSVEKIYENIDEIKGAVKDKLINDKENAFLSKKLASISFDFKIKNSLEDFKWDNTYKDDFRQYLTELEFRSMLQKFKLLPLKKEEKLPEIEKKYSVINNKKDFEELCEKIKSEEKIAFDTETSSLNFADMKIVGVSCSFKSGEAYYIPLGHFYLGLEPESQLDRKYVLDKLNSLFLNKKVIAHNIKFDFLGLKKYGLDFDMWFDTSVAHYLLEPESGHSLSKISEKYLNEKMIEFSELVPKGDSIASVEIERVGNYACADADICFRLYNLLEKKLKSENLEELFFKIEMPLVKSLSHMEWHGIKLDSDYLKTLEIEYSKKQQITQKEIFEIAGVEFNIDSPKQLSEILFNKLGIDPVKKTKTGFSTDASVLEELALKGVEIADKIVKYRNYAKLLNTYIIPLPKLTDRNGYLHTSFNQTVTTTGRLSSSNPNLQNIPIRTEDGNAIRKAFVAEKGKIFLSFDYSQIELRVLAHITEDGELINAFKNDIDVHSLTASGIFDVDISAVDKEMRRVAKMVNFGLIYGMNTYGLAGRLNIPNKEAARYIENFFAKYHKVKEFNEKVIEEAEKTRMVKTWFGRQRSLSGFNKNQLARMAVNTPIQGTAADIIKIAMNNLYNELELNYDKNSEVKMLLQIHDELVFEIPDTEEKIDYYKKRITEIMENCVKFKVPMKVDCEKGYNLGNLE